jgi:hypothetical protein
MKLLGAEELLDAWEAGLNQPPLQRALILLTAASPGASAETVGAMSVGERDQRLLRLREDLFGQRIQNMAECPDCGERVEWENRTRDAERRLLSRCVLKARRADRPCDFDDIPNEALQALGDQLASLDPLADLRMELRCPACDHAWVVVFDIAGFLCQEIDHWAGRMLRTVSELAGAFGWSERDILRISPLRRQLYLGMLG